jgi:hypothetical protein
MQIYCFIYESPPGEQKLMKKKTIKINNILQGYTLNFLSRIYSSIFHTNKCFITLHSNNYKYRT